MDVSVVVRRSPTAWYRTLTDGTVAVLDVASGAAHHLDVAAARLWRLVDVPVTVGALTVASADGQDAAALRAHVERFVRDGLTAGLLERVP